MLGSPQEVFEMRKLLFVGAVIMIAAGANADVIIDPSGVSCTGTGTNTECTLQVTCDVEPCAGLFVANSSQNATCTPTGIFGGVTVTFTANNDGLDPACAWIVVDEANANDPVPIVIDGSDGLPVEVQSFSIE